MAKPLKITVEEKGSKDVFEGSGCIVVILNRDKRSSEVDHLSTALIGTVSDDDLLMMLRFTLDKLQNTFDDPDLNKTDIMELLEQMKHSMIATEKGSVLSEGSGTAH